MENEKLTYKGLGLDIDRMDKMKEGMSDALKTTDARVLNSLGAFASLYDIGNLSGIENPVLVLKAEEPGSKQKLAFDHGYERSICHDMINHLVNDAIVMGARPMAVLDVIIAGAINEAVTQVLVEEMSRACKINGCSLVGGETSIQPGIISDNLCVLSSCVIGVVDKNRIIDGGKIQEGDSVLALSSNGLHTNGYTMVRKMLDLDESLFSTEVADGKNFLECVMEPHTAYYPALKDMMNPDVIHGMAHITGGGIEGNLRRIIPEPYSAVIDLSAISIPPIFKFMRNYNNSADSEMLSTFNCGVGLIMVVGPAYKDMLISKIGDGIRCYEIGSIMKTHNSEKVMFEGELQWQR